METRQLGNSDLQITPLGFGAWALGGSGWRFSWGHQDDNDSVAAIHRAIEVGINWIDTAAVYGLGHSEEVVAKALKGMSQKPYIFTKATRTWDEQGNIQSSLKADSLRRELENSLRRLQVETIDLYQLHWPNPDEDIEEGWSTLAQFQKEGKVRAIGVSNFNVAQLKRAQAIAPIASLQPPYSLLRREVEAEILPYCQQNNIGVIVYSPMASGLLSGQMTAERIAALPKDDWRRNGAEFQEPRLSRNLKLVDLLSYIGDSYGVTAGEVAIAWTLNNPTVTGAIVGLRRPDQLEGVISAADIRLAPDEIAKLESF
jgi:aryl-alcohol dehydrogenase-like predicted oxidoreductase